MRKTTKIFTMLLVAIMMCGMFVTSASAATTQKSAVLKRSEKDTEALTDAGEYYGWFATTKIKSQSATKVVTSVKLANRKYIFNITQTTQKTGASIQTKFRINKKNYVLTSIKMSLKKYAIGADKRQILEDKANLAADTLAKYAIKMGWQVAETTNYKNGIAICTHTYKNNKYTFSSTVRAQRKGGTIVVSYTRDSSKSTAGKIKSWLKNYKA